jgi:hypothetical protein
MQTFPRLQRGFISKRYLNYLLLILLLLIDNISTIYLFLPQLLGVYFMIFILQERETSSYDSYYLFVFVIFLLLVEANRDFLVLSLILFFLFSKNILLPIIDQYVSCDNCKRFIYVLLVYIGYYIFSIGIEIIFQKQTFDITPLWFIYYIIFDLIIVGLFYED